MNVSRRASELANDTASHRAWVRPAVQRLSAGCAENGAPSGAPDIGVNYS